MERFIEKKKKITHKLSNIAKEFYKKYESNLVSRECFICGDKTFTFLNKSHEFYNTVKCNKCLSKRIEPIFNEEILTIFYEDRDCAFKESNNYRKEMTKSLFENYNNKEYYKKLKNEIKFGHYFQKMEKVIDYIKKHDGETFNILEVGCSYGLTLLILNKMLKDINKNVNIYGMIFMFEKLFSII